MKKIYPKIINHKGKKLNTIKKQTKITKSETEKGKIK